MSEFSDDALANFLDTESRRAQSELEREALSAALNAEIVHVLDAYGAGHVWHADDTMMHRNIAQAVNELAEGIARGEIAASPLSPEDRIKTRTLDEIFVVSNIAMLLSVKRTGLDKDHEAQQKKFLLARLQVREFDEGWQAAVNALFDGDKLDLSKEEDIEIYTAVSQEEFFNEPDSRQQVLIETLLVPAMDMEPSKKRRVETAAMQLFLHLLEIPGNPAHRVEAEAYIDEITREALINEQQATTLRKLLDS